MDDLPSEQPTTEVHLDREEKTPFQPPAMQGGMPPRIGHYQPVEQIGKGGMGTIYRVEHAFLKRDFAMKVINPLLLDDPATAEYFSTETLLMGSLQHPNIVQTTDAGNDDGRLFLVMDLLHGRDLAKYVKDQGPLPVDEALGYLKQAAQGLAFAHRKGIIHRDVKPSNIFLTEDGVVKLLDLGIAKNAGIEGDRSCIHELGANRPSGYGLVGSPGFMAPEQILDGVSDARSDMYSLGCTFYFMLTGHLPFESPQYPSLKSVLDAQVAKNIPSLSVYRNDLNREAERLIRKMTAKNPSVRYQSMEELIAAIGLPAVYTLPAKRVGRLSLRRRITLAVSAAILAVLAVFPFSVTGFGLCGPCSAQECKEKRVIRTPESCLDTDRYDVTCDHNATLTCVKSR